MKLSTTLSPIPAPTDAMSGVESRPTISWIAQRVYRVAQERKSELLTAMLRQSEMRSVLVFVQRKIDADRLARATMRSGVYAASLHAETSQEERTAAIDAFRRGDCTVLVATDVAGRTLVVPRLSHVINFDVPLCSADYLNHVGRAARAGTIGAVITFVGPDEDRGLARILTEIRLADPTAEMPFGRARRSSVIRRRSVRRRARKRGLPNLRRGDAADNRTSKAPPLDGTVVARGTIDS